MPRTISVAAIQTSYGEDMQANIAKTVDFVREAAGRGAQVILPPELFEGEYFCRVEDEGLFANAAPLGEHKAVLAMQALAEALGERGIEANVLNAKNDAEEARIIAEAGDVGRVTVSTQMAGRGTDIVLGGNADIIADLNLRERGLNPVDTPEEYEAAWDEEIERMRALTKKEADNVRDAGGLYVLGTERHESRRIDNQLRGRSGRQGDPGRSKFYLSLQDDLMRIETTDVRATISGVLSGLMR